MSIQKPIQDESFRVERDVDASILLAHEVRGLADAPAKLLELGLVDGDTLSVITLLEIGPDGQVLNSRVGITGPKISQKTLATTLFAQAPENARLRMKLDYRCFNFPPGLTVSDWVSSDDLQWSIMKSNNMAQGGIYDQSEHKEINVSPWSCGAVITPTEESHVACVSLVAIPRPIADLNSLPGTATGVASAAYPVILLGDNRAAMAGVLETPRHDGLAFYPVVVNRGQPGSLLVAPESGSIRVAMRGVWSGNIEPNALVSSDWCLATQGPGEPDQTPIEAEFAWPPVEQEVEEEDSGFPSKVLGLYLLLADDTIPGAGTDDEQDVKLYEYQQSGANVFFFTFIHPVKMDVPKSFITLANSRGTNGDGAVPADTKIIFAIGGYGYSKQVNPWPWLTTKLNAEAMAEKVAKWKDDYNCDGIDLDIEEGAGNEAVAGENMIHFVRKIKQIQPDMIITQPVSGYPSLVVANDQMINAAWTSSGLSNGLLDSVGIMVYEA